MTEEVEEPPPVTCVMLLEEEQPFVFSVYFWFEFWGCEFFGTCVVPVEAWKWPHMFLTGHVAVTNPQLWSRWARSGGAAALLLCPFPSLAFLPRVTSSSPCCVPPAACLCEGISTASAQVCVRAAGTGGCGRMKASLFPGMGHLWRVTILGHFQDTCRRFPCLVLGQII